MFIVIKQAISPKYHGTDVHRYPVVHTKNCSTLHVFILDVCGNDSKRTKVYLNYIWHVSGSISRDFLENRTWKSHFYEFSEKTEISDFEISFSNIV